jgi:hypothetical protein
MRQLDKEIKRAAKQGTDLRKKSVKLFVNKLGRFLEKEIPRVAKLPDFIDGVENQAKIEAISVLGGLQTGLEESGLGSVVKQIRATYAEELGSLASRFSVSGIDNAFSSADRTIVKALIDNDVSRVTKLISPYIDDVSSTLIRAVIGGQKPDSASLIGDTTEVLESQLETELNTMLSGFSRTVTANKADELGLELFLYVGADDKLTRDFCQDVLRDRTPPIYTREEISAMQNDSGLDVMIYGGGYNCRHQWVALTEEDAIEMGWKRGD